MLPALFGGLGVAFVSKNWKIAIAPVLLMLVLFIFVPALNAGTVVGLAALGLHSLIDFPLRMPLIAVLAAAWAGLWAGTRPAAEEGRAAA